MKKYESYKESGIEWIGEVPEHWEVKKLKYIFSYEKGKNAALYTSEFISQNAGDYPVYSGMTENGGVLGKLSFSDYDLEQVLFVTTVGAKAMTLKLLSGKFSLSQNCALLINSKEPAIYNFYFYYLQQHFDYEKGRISLIMQPSLRFEDLDTYKVAYPPLSEQHLISNFLNHKTSHIDSLIQKKRQMIALLEEEKTAVINEAVTKGLNTDIPMKDSGVEWLGMVPAHWEVKKLKYLVSLINDSISTEGIAHKIALENIESNSGRLLQGELSFDFNGDGSHFIKGDVLFSKLRPYLAKVYLAKEEGVAAGELLVFRPKEEILSEFLFYRILSSDFIKEVNSSTYGSKMPRASWSFIEQLLIPIPSLNEQREIIQLINDDCKRIESVKAKAFKEIYLMQEYRTALISEAVTGKIDVRDYQPEPIKSQQLEIA